MGGCLPRSFALSLLPSSPSPLPLLVLLMTMHLSWMTSAPPGPPSTRLCAPCCIVHGWLPPLLGLQAPVSVLLVAWVLLIVIIPCDPGGLPSIVRFPLGSMECSLRLCIFLCAPRAPPYIPRNIMCALPCLNKRQFDPICWAGTWIKIFLVTVFEHFNKQNYINFYLSE